MGEKVRRRSGPRRLSAPGGGSCRSRMVFPKVCPLPVTTECADRQASMAPILPARKSSIACRISSSVFITKGP